MNPGHEEWKVITQNIFLYLFIRLSDEGITFKHVKLDQKELLS